MSPEYRAAFATTRNSHVDLLDIARCLRRSRQQRGRVLLKGSGLSPRAQTKARSTP